MHEIPNVIAILLCPGAGRQLAALEGRVEASVAVRPYGSACPLPETCLTKGN